MGECVCHQRRFCRPCHCRRIAAEREASPGYRERHKAAMEAAFDRRAGVSVTALERQQIRPLCRATDISARSARLVLVRSRPADQPAEGTRT